jgi:hypothetical protein
MELYVKIASSISDPMYSAANFWNTPCSFIEAVAKQLMEQQREAANLANYSSATTAALLEAVLAGLGGQSHTFDPLKFLPCATGSIAATEPSQEELEVDSEALRIFFIEMEAKRLPGWVFAGLSNNFSRWRKQIA